MLLLAVLPALIPVIVVVLLREPDRYRLSRLSASSPSGDVLIVYTVGVPYKTISELVPE